MTSTNHPRPDSDAADPGPDGAAAAGAADADAPGGDVRAGFGGLGGPGHPGGRSRVTHVGRRVFFGLLGLGTVGTLVGGAVSEVGRSAGLASVLPADGFRIYTVAPIPEMTLTDWTLTVSGKVAKPTTFTYDDLAALGIVERTQDFHCVTGWSVDGVRWRGVPLTTIFDAVGAPSDPGLGVNFASFDGAYTTSLSMADARNPDNLVAFGRDGKPLSKDQGYPARVIVPSMYGYKGTKWVDRIEIADRRTSGYWEVRGYDDDAYVGRSNGYGAG